MNSISSIIKASFENLKVVVKDRGSNEYCICLLEGSIPLVSIECWKISKLLSEMVTQNKTKRDFKVVFGTLAEMGTRMNGNGIKEVDWNGIPKFSTKITLE